MHDETPSFTETTLFDAFPPVSTAAWRQQMEIELKGSTYERLIWNLPEDLALAPFYRAEDLQTLSEAHVETLAALRAEGAPWRIRQDVAAPSMVEARRQAQAALAGGAEHLGFSLDLDARGSGIPIGSMEDFQRLLVDLPVERTSLHFTGAAPVRVVLAFLLEASSRLGVPQAALAGSVTFDPVAALARTGSLPTGVAFDELAAAVRDLNDTPGDLRVLGIDARPYHEAGGTTVHELACALAAASETLAQLTERGLTPGSLFPHLRFTLAVDTPFFLELAKLRAFRLLFARLARAFDDGPHTAHPYVHAETSRWSLTRYDPYANLLRATTQAASAILGGCDELTILPFDAPTGASSEGARRLVRNIQLILRHESHLDKVADPGAGSYYLEVLTDRLARKAWAVFQRVEAQGGLLAALRAGSVQAMIQESRAGRLRDVSDGKKALVGVNRFPDGAESRHPAAPAAPDASSRFVHLPPSMDAIREHFAAGYTLSDRAEATEDRMVAPPLPVGRAAEPLETMRLRTERHAEGTGRRPLVFLLLAGDPVMASARATFSRNFFGCAGFDVLEGPPRGSVEAGAEAALEAGSDIVVLCSADAAYAEVGPAACAVLQAADSPPQVVVAGFPEALIDDLRAAGVSTCIHRKSPLLATLEFFQRRLGMAV